jgi:hypothetical protein
VKLRWLWWFLGLVAFLTMLYTCALPGDLPAGRTDTTGLAGIYTVNGVDPTGAGYSGTLVITATDNPDRYQMEWLITGTIRTGAGTREGERLDVTWSSDVSASGPAEGTGSYLIGPDGSMAGTWLVTGHDGEGTEEVFPEP